MENNLQKEKNSSISPRNKKIAIIASIVIFLSAIGGLTYWNISSSRIYIENSLISAEVINLYPTVSGTLQEVFVNVGDSVRMSDPIARVGNELVKAKSNGQILSINKTIGTAYSANQAVATMINPEDLRVIGEVEEDKGLKNIKIGQEAIFTVDAFGSKKYSGVVEEISPTSNTGDIVFNISDQRETNSFDVKIRFNSSKYPELKNGMSAKLWIYK